MGKIVSKVRQVRLAYANLLGRDVRVEEVARAIGISGTALRKIENSKVSISHPVLAKLCEFYKVQPGELLTYEEWLARHAAQAGTTHSTAG